jgi:hypothetical protein
LASQLRKTNPLQEVIIILAGEVSIPVQEWHTSSYSSYPHFKLASPVFPDGINVPLIWFENCAIITISQIESNVQNYFHATLFAQASGLRMGTRQDVFFENEILFEAHRLASSDLAFVCGPDGSWLASYDDLALEVACAKANGLEPEKLPGLKYFSQHEIISFNLEPDFILPDWKGTAASRWKVFLSNIFIELGRMFIRTVSVIKLVYQNWWRVSRFFKREWGRLHAR